MRISEMIARVRRLEAWAWGETVPNYLPSLAAFEPAAGLEVSPPSCSGDRADDAAYRLRALLRTIETRARDLGEGTEIEKELVDLALLAELGQDLADVLHQAIDAEAANG